MAPIPKPQSKAAQVATSCIYIVNSIFHERGAFGYPSWMRNCLIVALCFSGLLWMGCQNNKPSCIQECEKAFESQEKACGSKTQSEADSCSQKAKESRWSCRKQCGLDEPSPTPLASPAATPTASSPAIPSVLDLGKVCDGKAEPTAAAVDNTSGAHNAAVVATQNLGSDLYLVDTITNSYDSIGPKSGKSKQADAYALVVCVSVKKHQKVKECPFAKHTLELHDATYQIRVVEARTANELKSIDIAVAADRQCPPTSTSHQQRDISLPSFVKTVLEEADLHVHP